MKITHLLLLIAAISLASCDEETTPDSTPKLIFKFKFDSTQERLDNLGQVAVMPVGNAGQSPSFNGMSAHYLELTETALVQVGGGQVLYKAPETTAGGANAIDFDQAVIVGEGETFLEVPLADVDPGTYEYLRVSLAYQNYDVDFEVTVPGFSGTLSGTIASFVGFNTFINSYQVKDSTLTVGDDRLQGYWAFETSGSPVPVAVQSGQAPGTTVPNPIAATSPIPAGSCLVTGEFTSPLTITGNEGGDIVVEVSLSVNKSFEWQDTNGNDKWDPLLGEQVVDMGLRGLVPSVQ